MKKLALAMGLVVLSPSFASAIMGKHDLSSGGGNSVRAVAGESGGTEVCIFCHIPHVKSDANAVGSARPLWNHALSTRNLVWLNATTVRGTTLPTDVSTAPLEGALACMGCHDGSVAVGSILRRYNTTTNTVDTNVTIDMVNGSKLTNDMLNTNSSALIDALNMEHNHPVGIEGPPADKTGFTSYVQTDGGTSVWYKPASDSNNYVVCGSCHNPHLTVNKPFLRISNAGSAICTSCHNIQ